MDCVNNWLANMKYSISFRTLLVAFLVLVLSFAGEVNASFDSFYRGAPDLVLNAIEQTNATTFRVVVCNQGEASTGAGKLGLVLQSNEGQIEERTYKNVTIPSGSCIAYLAQAVDGYTTSGARKVSVTGTIRFEGNRKELKLTNNRLTLPAKRSRIDASDAQNTDNQVSTDPVYDLWGNSESGVNWYSSTNTATNNSLYSNSNGYSNSYSTNYSGDNGDFSPASPTWAMRKAAQNVVYVYTGPGNGSWYSYTSGNNGNYYYTPYSTNGYNTTYRGNSTSFSSGSPVNTDAYPGYQSVTVGSNRPGYSYVGSDTNCYTWNSNTNRYEWMCNGNSSNNGYWNNNDYGQPDLYLSNLKQNGGRSELIAKVCNQARAMDSTRQITIRISNGNYNTTTSTFVQLQKNGCSDVTVPFGDLNLNYNNSTYLLYGEIDLYNGVSETREDNNTGYWRLQIQ